MVEKKTTSTQTAKKKTTASAASKKTASSVAKKKAAARKKTASRPTKKKVATSVSKKKAQVTSESAKELEVKALKEKQGSPEPKKQKQKKAKGNKDKQAKSKSKKNKKENLKVVESEKKTTRKKIKNKVYERELARLQIELVKLQEWIKHKGLRVVVLFEGRDAAGKGGAIKRITQSLSPRICPVIALPAPTEREKTQWYFQRYVQHLPAAGEMVLFDRSWYNRAGVERVMGFCTDEEYSEFLRSCPEFERMLVRSGIILIKYWFSVSDEEQERRFQGRIFHPTKHWKLSPMDLESRKRWFEYSKAKDEMFAHTDIKQAPWHVVNGDIKKAARLNVITHLLSMIDYEDLTPTPMELPPRQRHTGYIRPPISDQTFVPEIY